MASMNIQISINCVEKGAGNAQDGKMEGVICRNVAVEKDTKISATIQELIGLDAL